LTHWCCFIETQGFAPSEWDVLRAAYRLGASGDRALVSRCLDELELAARRADTAAEIWLSNAIVAFGADTAGPELLRRAQREDSNAHLRVLLLDTLMDCGVEDALAADAQAVFARCLHDKEGWVRYAGLTGLEQLGLTASEHAAVVASVLEDDRPFVAFTAISTLFYTAGKLDSLIVISFYSQITTYTRRSRDSSETGLVAMIGVLA